MALAHLKYLGQFNNKHRFHTDTGSNRFFQFKIGAEKGRYKGMERLDAIRLESSLFERPARNANPIRTDFAFEIEDRFFQQDNRYIQLASYQNKRKVAPAFSSVIAVKPSLAKDKIELRRPISFSQSSKIMQNSTLNIPVRNIPFHYREPSESRAMFWSAIVNALPKILPAITPVVGQLLGGNKGNPPSTSNGQPASGESTPAISADLVDAIADLVKKLSEKNQSSAQGLTQQMAFNPAMLAQLAPLLEKVVSPETINAIGDQPMKLFKAIGDAVLKMDQQEMAHLEKLNPGVKDDSIERILKSMSAVPDNGRFSSAKVAPALLAALPALMPVIEKVLDPKTLQAIGDQPVKMFKAIGDAVLKMDQQEMEHLERLNPGVDDPSIERILKSMSLSPSRKLGIPFKFDPRVDINFLDVQQVDLNGNKKVVYSKKQDIWVPISISTKANQPPKRAIPKVIVELIIQDSDSMAVLLEKKFKIKELFFDQAIKEIVIRKEELAHLPTGKDLKLEISIIWKSSRNRQNKGSFKNHYIMLSADYIFDQIGPMQGQEIPLNDVVQHRSFWHKLWEGGLSRSRRWNIELDLKYFLLLQCENNEAQRLATKKKLIADNARTEEELPSRRKIKAKMKAGLELSLQQFNLVLQQLGQPMLSIEQLEALKTNEFKQHFQQVSRAHVELKGRAGDSAALWAYPEIGLYKVFLKKPGTVTALGQVTQFEQSEVLFPKPTSIHFIGTKSER